MAEPSSTPTITPVWFPPTITPTPLPTATMIPPTIDPRPSLGRLIYTDTFQSPVLWVSRQAAEGSVAFGNSELSLAVSGGKTYLSSLRLTPALTNFYAEITTTLVFCTGLDEYGFLVRAANEFAYYRFGFSCDGRARVDRIVDSVAASLMDWQYGTGILPGGPGVTYLAIWARGDTFGLLSNGRQVLEIKDPKLLSGGLGVYVRSTGVQPVTINFSDLSVWELGP